MVRAYYYVAVLESDEFSPLKPLTDWLAYNGYTLVMKPAKEHIDAEGRRRVKGDMKVEIVCDMFEMASRIDHMVLISGHGDLVEAVHRVQRQTRVMVVGANKTSPPMIADELRRQADEFVELAAIGAEFTRRRDTVRPAPQVQAAAVTVTPANPFGEPTEAPRKRRTAAA